MTNRPPKHFFLTGSCPPWLLTLKSMSMKEYGIDPEIIPYLVKLNNGTFFTEWSCAGHWVPIYKGRKLKTVTTNWPYICIITTRRGLDKILDLYWKTKLPDRRLMNSVLNLTVQKRGRWVRVHIGTSTETPAKQGRKILFKYMDRLIASLGK